MDSTMDDWKALLTDMEQFDENVFDQFKCELALGNLTEKKIEAANLVKSRLVHWLYKFL